MNIRALLELCRISNLPTVWSNVTAGVLFGGFISAYQDWKLFNATEYLTSLQSIIEALDLLVALLTSMIGISLIYCAGMVLNDYWDRDIDAIERPERPIPSGRISQSTAKSLSIYLFIAGFVCAGGWWHLASLLVIHEIEFNQLISLFALLTLIVCVIGYNRTHAKGAVSVLLMAACRSLAFLVPALYMCKFRSDLAYWIVLLGPAITLFLYTLAISIVARREMETKRFAGPKTIMNMIAAMPLLDAVWLVVMGLWPASLFCVACAGMTKLAHRKVAGS